MIDIHMVTGISVVSELASQQILSKSYFHFSSGSNSLGILFDALSKHEPVRTSVQFCNRKQTLAVDYD